jgi:glycosyltransferase involved in cell wall biosynthesis
VPVTLRGRATDTAPDAIARALALPKLVRAYLMPGAGGPAQDARLRATMPVFDTALFAPAPEQKDRRLVLRAAPGLPESDLRFVLELAKLLPAQRVVVAVATVRGHEREIEALRAYGAEIGSPAELLVDAPRAEVARLFAVAGLCVHSTSPFGQRPRGAGPASLAEAMATGAYVLARKVPPLIGFVGGAGAHYDDVAEAAALIRATEAWTDAEWRDAQNRAIDHAFRHHADEIVLRPLFEDWCAIAAARAKAEAEAAEAEEAAAAA